MQLELDLKTSVLAFPFSRRTKLIREAAATISRESEANGVRYWNALNRTLTAPLLRAGVPQDQVQAEANRFRDAVQAEIWRTDGHIGGAK